MRTRKEIEELEDKILAPYAMKSKYSVGRLYKENDHSGRTAYQRDRDRIVHCEAFRKLEYKTQVFVIFEGDYYRTRLTHTIEVAQLARTIGRNLRLNEDLIEAVALAHDLGHPPFGHAGEDALNDIMKEAGCRKFNHNVRSFDIVTKFEKRYPDFDGLNLTNEVMIGILKHQTIFDDPGSSKEIKGRLVRDEGATFEAQVVDVADSLAYLNHDIDDGLTSGCITKEDLMQSELWKKAVEKVGGVPKSGNLEMFKYQVVKMLIDMQVRDFLEATGERLEKFAFKNSKEVKDYNFKLSRDGKKTVEPMIGFSSTMAHERNHLQSILNEKLYHHYRVERMTTKARRILKSIFEVYADNPKQLPYVVCPRDRKYSKNAIYEIICDYIASMTDRFALDEYKKLFEPYQKV
ncbi:MAG: deoxyguanosinetriphosphate triphosphohydrolase [Candidatus Omnitrophica bacterium]|nr:deoxyguanosinetriphosphate triphosphohydrolase [Candidatus Omnitrophota bacterium]